MFEIIAHRGASKEAPENTLSAIHKAIEIGVNYVEIDVHMTKDGVPVTFHDAHTGRTTNGKTNLRITDLRLEEIKSLDAGAWFHESYCGETIPTLHEVFDIERKNHGLMIEIKKGHAPVKPLVQAIASAFNETKKADNDNLVFGSFSPYVIKEMRIQAPSASIIGIVEDFNMIPILRSLKISHLALWHKLINPQLIKSLQAEGTKVWAYTVDTIPLAETLISMNVDGLITNDPRTLLEFKKSL
jgi:glycerophosphoryl diester phosphodiesterase